MKVHRVLNGTLMSLRAGFEEAIGFLHLSQVRKCEPMTRIVGVGPCAVTIKRLASGKKARA